VLHVSPSLVSSALDGRQGPHPLCGPAALKVEPSRLFIRECLEKLESAYGGFAHLLSLLTSIVVDSLKGVKYYISFVFNVRELCI